MEGDANDSHTVTRDFFLSLLMAAPKCQLVHSVGHYMLLSFAQRLSLQVHNEDENSML